MAAPTTLATTLQAHQGAVLALAFNTDGSYVLSGGHDKVVRLWNPYRASLVKEYGGAHGYEVLDVAVTNDSSKFASAGGDRQTFLWDVMTGKVVRRFARHDQRVNSIALNADASVLFTGSYDRTCCAWDLRSHGRDPINVFKDAKDSVSRVVCTPTEVVTASIDGCLRTYDLRAGRLITDYMGDAISSMAISKDGNCTLISCLNSIIRLIDRTSGEVLNEYDSPAGSEAINTSASIDSCLTFDDGLVASGSESGTIRWWDLVQAKVVRQLTGHKGIVSRLSSHPTKPILVSAGVDGTVRMWQ